MTAIFTRAELAAAWESGYWHGTSHQGPLNDAAVAAKNPYNTEKGRSVSPKSATARITANPEKATIMNKNTLHGDTSAAASQPPAGFTPNYFDNEFLAVRKPEFIDYSGPDIERPGYKILSSWTPESGLRLYIDHDDNEAFTVPEICDLVSTLSKALQTMANEAAPNPHAPEGYALAEGGDDTWIGEDIVHGKYMIEPTWSAATKRRTIDLWTAKATPDESYTHFTPQEAIRLASDLFALAKDAMEGK